MDRRRIGADGSPSTSAGRSRWRVYIDASDEPAAGSVLTRLLETMNVVPPATRIERGQEEGYVAIFDVEHGASGWSALIYDVLALGQKIGRAWRLSGSVDFELDGWCDDPSEGSVKSVQWILVRSSRSSAAPSVLEAQLDFLRALYEVTALGLIEWHESPDAHDTFRTEIGPDTLTVEIVSFEEGDASERTLVRIWGRDVWFTCAVGTEAHSLIMETLRLQILGWGSDATRAGLKRAQERLELLKGR